MKFANNLRICLTAATFLVSLSISTTILADTLRLYYDSSSPQISFAAGDIKGALEKQKHTVQIQDIAELDKTNADKKIVLSIVTDQATTAKLTANGGKTVSALGEQAYAIRTTTQGEAIHWVIGGDATGTMYGGLQLADDLAADGLKGSYDETESPCLLNRGMKLNLPLDRRTPTYVGGWSSESAKKAIPHVWDMSFWKSFIDQQARNRYNTLTVWVHHPFPALVKLQDYPKVCLPNIEGFDGFTLDMPHEARVKFWRAVMQYAHDRGMKFYFFNWNIHLEHASDQYPELSEEPDDKETLDYMNKSMRALLETYPELDGFGITSGDGMDGTNEENTEWTWNAMGKAVMEYLKENPQRKFNLIHRGVKSNPETVNHFYAPIKEVPNATLRMSAKYAMAHMYSTPTPRWTGDIKSCNELGLKTWLTFRNDDYFYLNWGDHQFVRDFINGIPLKESVVGMYIGIDGYNPSRAYCHKDETLNGKLEIDRRWYMEMLWGRISYNPNIQDDRFQKMIAKRFPSISAKDMFDAWTLASRSLPKVTELIMKDWALDFHWYPEGCWSDPERCTGFRTIDDRSGQKGGFAGQDVAKGSDLASIAASAKDQCDGKKSSYVLADEMEQNARQALTLISSMQSGGDAELNMAIKNIKQLAMLSSYYTHKIRGATFLKVGKKDQAKEEMGKAYCRWILYTRLMDSTYHTQSFRSVSIAPDWNYADAAALKEYTDLGGEGIPDSDDLFALTVVDTEHGSIALNPSGSVYEKGSVVKVTATPEYGYAFAKWDGDLTGTDRSITLTMNGKKKVSAQFIESKQDQAPWSESFEQSDGTISHGAPTSWKADRKHGIFHVAGNRLMINGAKDEGVFETAEISIPSGKADVSLDVQSAGGLDSGDSVSLYIIADGGEKKMIGEKIKGAFNGSHNLKQMGIAAKTIKLRIETQVSASDEFYFMDNITILPSKN
jgi:Divergent InlB B-repeat domain